MPTQQKLLVKVGCLYRLLSVLVLIVFHHVWVSAQKVNSKPKVVGQYLYDKLSATQKEYEEALAKGDSLEVAEMCYRMGKRYIAIGDFQTAQKFFLRSLRIREPRKQYEGIGKVYLFMAHYQMGQNNYRQAVPLLQKAMANFRAAGSPHELMSGSLAMAGAHALGFTLSQKSPGIYPAYSLDSTLYYFRQAEKLALQLKKPSDLANIYLAKGDFLLKTNAPLGLAYLKKADAVFSSEKLPYPIINSSLILAEAYLNVKQPAESIKWLKRAQHLIDSSRHGDFQQESKLFQTYARYYEQTGNWKQALANQQKYHDFTVEAMNADREGAITSLSLKYESQKKEAALEEQRRLIAITLGLCVTAILASVVFYHFFQKYKRISQQNAALVMEQNHRVKNNFQEVINLLTLQSNRLTNEDAQKAVMEGLLRMEAMALVHRRLYDNSDRLVEINLLSFIPELVEGILHSYSYAHIHPLYKLETIWLHVDQAVPLGLIINELVTNSCKYAFPAHPSPVLEVACQQTDHTIALEVMDNGPGYVPQKSNKTFGLKLIKTLVQRLDGQTQLLASGTTYRLSFPIHAH